ncbi:MAG: hypothetical protein OXS29_16285 [bacterium]|nr:hypothetical protein [bacterium]MDE0289265.1 hypothetical protein [bacterium]
MVFRSRAVVTLVTIVVLVAVLVVSYAATSRTRTMTTTGATTTTVREGALLSLLGEESDGFSFPGESPPRGMDYDEFVEWMATSTTAKAPEARAALLDADTAAALREAIAAVTSTTMFVPRVASPFSRTELDYLNAVRVADTFRAGFPEGEVSADGIDTDGDGRADVGWDDIDALRSYTATLEVGYDLCRDDYRQRFLRIRDDDLAEWRERFSVVSRAYLC